MLLSVASCVVLLVPSLELSWVSWVVYVALCMFCWYFCQWPCGHWLGQFFTGIVELMAWFC